MPVPSFRVPVRVARGTKSALDAGLASLQEGEVCYATDENALYVVEGGALTEATGSASSVSAIDDLSDVDTSTAAPTDGQVLIWNNVDGEWQPGDVVSDLSTISVDALSDVDTTTVAPVDGQALVWNNSASQWEPGGVSGEIEWTLTESASTDYIFAGAGFAGTETDPTVYVIRGQTYKFTNAMGAHPFQIQSTQGLGGTAYNDGVTNNAVSNGTLVWEVRMDAPSELYYQCTSHADMNGTIHVLDEGGGVASIDDLSDVDTSTVAPTAGQVLVWNDTASLWEPGTIVSSGPGAGLYLSETQTAASGTADFTNLGYSGILQKVTSDLDTWIVLYSSSAERTADSSRAYNTDPTPGSGVLFEAYVTAGGTVVATPGTTYMNNDTTLTEAVYAAVRDQAGAAVNASVTFSAYGLAAITTVSGGTFGSG